MAAPALPNLYNHTYQRPGQDILRIFCFKNCHAHQTEISSNRHKINQAFKNLCDSSALKISQSRHVGNCCKFYAEFKYLKIIVVFATCETADLVKCHFIVDL